MLSHVCSRPGVAHVALQGRKVAEGSGLFTPAGRGLPLLSFLLLVLTLLLQGSESFSVFLKPLLFLSLPFFFTSPVDLGQWITFVPEITIRETASRTCSTITVLRVLERTGLVIALLSLLDGCANPVGLLFCILFSFIGLRTEKFSHRMDLQRYSRGRAVRGECSYRTISRRTVVVPVVSSV